MFNKIHHVAIICSDYQVSKDFYVHKLGFEIMKEVYREDRDSYKLDLGLNGSYIIELFSFPTPPKRPSYPEACGLRHLAFEVDHLQDTVDRLKERNIDVEGIRIDPITQRRFTFFRDPDGLPLEIYER